MFDISFLLKSAMNTKTFMKIKEYFYIQISKNLFYDFQKTYSQDFTKIRIKFIFLELFNLLNN